MNRSFGQTAKAVGGGALLGVCCAFGLGVMAGLYWTPVINLEVHEPTMYADMSSILLMGLLFPFALWLGLVAGFQQVKGRPTLKRLLWGAFLGILFSGLLISGATTEEVVKYRALQGIEVAGGRFDSIADSINEEKSEQPVYADSSNEEWLEQPVRVSRKPWFSRPLAVVGPVLGLLLGLIVPRWLRWGERAPKPWRSALSLVKMGLCLPFLMPFLMHPERGKVVPVIVVIFGALAVVSVIIVIVSDLLFATRRRDVRRTGKVTFLVDVAKLTGFGFLLSIIGLFFIGSVTGDVDDQQHLNATHGYSDE